MLFFHVRWKNLQRTNNINTWNARGQTGKGVNRTLLVRSFMACIAGVQTGCACLFRILFLWFFLLEEQKNRSKTEPGYFLVMYLLLSGGLSLLLMEIIIRAG